MTNSETQAERKEGRPTDAPPAPGDPGRPNQERTGGNEPDADRAHTVAPEEKGAEPETETAPGSDL